MAVCPFVFLNRLSVALLLPSNSPALLTISSLVPPPFLYPFSVRSNDRRMALGTRQNGEARDDVVLPPWANGSAEEFIRLHRQALESEPVSRQLHRWIDLIWGFQQQGAAAEASFNVFYHLTYESALAAPSMQDPLTRRSAEAQIANFGQVPSQLFIAPHIRYCWRGWWGWGV